MADTTRSFAGHGEFQSICDDLKPENALSVFALSRVRLKTLWPNARSLRCVKMHRHRSKDVVD
jgi:hypothetical protein